MRRRHRTVSSYRLQLSARFRFDDAAALASYLDALGVTDCYTSPLLKSAPGSDHGYDVVDHASLNPRLGSDEDFVRFADALTARGMGLLLDFVPNHMGLDERSNLWWRDVLQHGPASRFARYFDIAWTPTPTHPEGRVLLPILEDPYGDVLHRGDIRLADVQGDAVVTYFDKQLPLAPGTLDMSNRSALDTINGVAGDPASWDRLHELLERQWYRLTHWKTSADEINYRRFFDVNHLGGLRMEVDEVFEAAHVKVLELIAAGHVTGLRLDHPDGLLDPAAYFERLRRTIDAIPVDEPSTPFFLVIEKILTRDEQLAAQWPVTGTTGYGFLNSVNGLFVAAANEKALRAAYAGTTGERAPFDEMSYHSRRLVTRSSMASELSVLTQALKQLADEDRRTRDFTATALSRVISEVVSSMPVYRTYVSGEGFSATDREVIDFAIDRARRRNPVVPSSIFMFLRQTLLAAADDPAVVAKRRFAMKFQQFSAPVQAKGIEDTAFYRYNALLSLNEVGGDPSSFGESVDRFHAGNIVRRQRWPGEMTTTSTHDTKRGEDARARLDVLSEIPLEWRRVVRQWRRINALRRSVVDRAPAPDPNDEYLFYQTLIGAWPAEASDAPVPLEASSDLVERLRAFMQKATREAKRHTSWVSQNRGYEDAAAEFVERTLRGSTAERFLRAFVPFARDVARAGMVNSLSQVVLKIGSPGVPDFYQGTELWQLDMTDPDNRRPVDFAHRRQLLADMEPWLENALRPHDEVPAPLPSFVSGLLDGWHDGRIKMFIAAAALRLRRAWADLFLEGSYVPLTVTGPGAEHVVAFAREHGPRLILIAVPRLLTTLSRRPGGSHAGPWQDTKIDVPFLHGAGLRHLFTGETIDVQQDSIGMPEVFRVCPVALLCAERSASA